jgi:hypothetical protein
VLDLMTTMTYDNNDDDDDAENSTTTSQQRQTGGTTTMTHLWQADGHGHVLVDGGEELEQTHARARKAGLSHGVVTTSVAPANNNNNNNNNNNRNREGERTQYAHNTKNRHNTRTQCTGVLCVLQARPGPLLSGRVCFTTG